MLTYFNHITSPPHYKIICTQYITKLSINNVMQKQGN
nr:MAG TPA: hypothetical protein [Caudoviricetes sp.]